MGAVTQYLQCLVAKPHPATLKVYVGQNMAIFVFDKLSFEFWFLLCASYFVGIMVVDLVDDLFCIRTARRLELVLIRKDESPLISFCASSSEIPKAKS